MRDVTGWQWAILAALTLWCVVAGFAAYRVTAGSFRATLDTRNAQPDTEKDSDDNN